MKPVIWCRLSSSGSSVVGGYLVTQNSGTKESADDTQRKL